MFSADSAAILERSPDLPVLGGKIIYNLFHAAKRKQVDGHFNTLKGIRRINLARLC